MRRLALTALTCALAATATAAHADPLVIAHRGASGYLPEHTLEAKTLAYAMGADYIEQDLVMTRDDQLVVLHDIHLDGITDVARVFPGRARKDGRHHVIDFDLAELRRLTVTERTEAGKPKYPARFPPGRARFAIHTFAEEIELLQGLERTLGRPVGLYPEIKAPWHHRQHGKDITTAVLTTLKGYGYTRKTDRIYLQCFDPRELERIRRLMPTLGLDLRLVQLLAPTEWGETMVVAPDGTLTPYDTAWMLQPGGMKRIATYADGVGPWLPMVVRPAGEGTHRLTPLVADAHRAGLVVHPYTFRADAGQIPPYAKDFEALVRLFVTEAEVDGLFTDFPDRARRVIDTLPD